MNELNLQPRQPSEFGPDFKPGSDEIYREIYRLIDARVEKLQKLEDFVHTSIQQAIEIAIQTGEFSQTFRIEHATNVRYTVEIDFLPGAKDFTSILRLVTISLDLGDGTHVTVKMVAKLAFDKTQPRILQEPSALDSLNEHLSDKTGEEFKRTNIISQVLQSCLEERILPKGFFCVSLPGSTGTVVFYELIEGSTLEEVILSSSLTSEKVLSLFFKVGQQLATWHSSLGPPVKDYGCFTNRTDRIEAYKRKFPNFERLLDALIRIFNKWVSTESQATPAAIFHENGFIKKINIIWSKIDQHLAEFKDSNNSQLVLCHRDFKPENIIVQNTGQSRVCFIDNDAFHGLPGLDLFKMVSRTVPILLKHPELKDRIVEYLNSFLTSYLSHRKDNHFNPFNFRLASVFIALDLLSILDS